MMNLMLMVNFFFLLLLTISKFIHPLFIGVILLILTISISMNLMVFFYINWFSYLLFLIMVGGLMILFLYFVSFIMNLKISFMWFFFKNLMFKLMFLYFLVIMFFFPMNFFNINLFEEIFSLFKNLNLIIIDNNMKTLMFLYNYPMNLILIMCFIYLFVTMTLIVKLCLSKKKSIRKLNLKDSLTKVIKFMI